MLTRIGFNVDLQAMEWGSVVQRRASREPIDKGGWNIFYTYLGGFGNISPGTEHRDPRQRHRSLVRLAQQRKIEELLQRLVRCAGPGGATEDLRGDADGVLAESDLRTARHV